jgi:hypothetical protein
VPVRKIPKSYTNVTGLTATTKADEMTGYESPLEYYCQKLVTFNDNVKRYEEQPLKVYFRDAAGKLHSYTPDIFIEYREDIAPAKWWRPLLAEIKPRNKLRKHWEELKPKFRAAKRYAEEQGLDFTIITDAEIINPFLKSVVFLLEFRRMPIDESQSSLLIEALEELGETDPKTLLQATSEDLTERAYIIPTLWRLVADRKIQADLAKPLTMRTRIRLFPSHKEETDECFLQHRAERSSGKEKRWRALRHHSYLSL